MELRIRARHDRVRIDRPGLAVKIGQRSARFGHQQAPGSAVHRRNREQHLGRDPTLRQIRQRDRAVEGGNSQRPAVIAAALNRAARSLRTPSTFPPSTTTIVLASLVLRRRAPLSLSAQAPRPRSATLTSPVDALPTTPTVTAPSSTSARFVQKRAGCQRRSCVPRRADQGANRACRQRVPLRRVPPPRLGNPARRSGRHESSPRWPDLFR